MKIGHILIVFSAVVLNHLDFTSEFDCLPNGAPIPGIPRRRTSNLSDSDETPEMSLSPPTTNSFGSLFKSSSAEPLVNMSSTYPPAGPHFSGSLLKSSSAEPLFNLMSSSLPARPHSSGSLVISPPAEPLVRLRSKSPRGRMPFLQELEFEIGRFRTVCLVPNVNPNRRFEIRKYTFPSNKPIQLRGNLGVLMPIPAEQKMVLSTSDGDVFAILENHKILRGIYTTKTRTPKRAKMNMHSGKVAVLTQEEIGETLLGSAYPISKFYKVITEEQ